MEAFENRSHPAITSIVDTYPTTDPNVTVKVNPDSEYLRTKVLEPVLETGADVVVFMHSYGGTYGASSLEGLSKEERQSKGLKGGIIATVQTAAFIAPTGATALDCMGVDRNNLPYWIEYDVGGHLLDSSTFLTVAPHLGRDRYGGNQQGVRQASSVQRPSGG